MFSLPLSLVCVHFYNALILELEEELKRRRRVLLSQLKELAYVTTS